MKKFLLSTMLFAVSSHAIASDTVSMTSAEKLFNQHDLKLTYPVVLVFDAKGKHIRQYAGTTDKPMTPAMLTGADFTVSKLEYADLASAWPVEVPGREGALVLLTIDERMCPACATETEAFTKLHEAYTGQYSFTTLEVEFR